MQVIDELVLQLGLDSSKFTEGRQRFGDELGKSRQALETFGKNVEEQGHKISEVFSVVKRGATGILAAFIGNEAAQFIERVATMDASTGRLARSIGESTRELSVWQNMVRAVGGTAEDASATFGGLNDAFMNMMMRGQMPDAGFASLMGRAGIIGTDSPSAVMQKTMQWLAASGATPQDQRFWLQQIPGMNQNMMFLLMDIMKSPEKMRHLREQIEKLGVASDESAEKAADLQRKTGELDTALDNLARSGFPALTMIINALVSVLERIPAGTLAGVITGGAAGAVAGSVIPGVGTIGGAIVGGAIGGLAGEAYGGRGVTSGQTRGDRNNNPGNIEYGPWAIAHGAFGSDGRFAIFPNAATGEAAMAALLQERYRGLTLADIQKRWVHGSTYAGAPDAGYLGAMSKATGLRPGDVPNLNDPAILKALMHGMMRGEGTDGLGGNKTSSVNIGTINVSSNKADPKAVADQIPDAMRRFAMLGGADTGLV